MITHDLGVIAEISDDVAIMYAGQVVEYASADSLFAAPLHPYTIGLLDSRPRLSDYRSKERLRPILGAVPSPTRHPTGCRFHPRCPFSTAECEVEAPEMRELSAGHQVRCHWAEKIQAGLQPQHDVEVKAAG
jgi:oligopeptide/dipeptide ABC transporter ATP-binding protein